MESHAHEITRVDEQSDAFRIHVDLPPVNPKDVEIDASPDGIDIITSLGKSRNVYCSIEVPLGVVVERMTTSIRRGHLELVLPKASSV